MFDARKLLSDTWIIRQGQHNVHYDAVRLLEYLNRDNRLVKQISLKDQEQRLIAVLATYLEQELASNPGAIVYMAFMYGYAYAKLLETENVSLREGISQNDNATS